MHYTITLTLDDNGLTRLTDALDFHHAILAGDALARDRAEETKRVLNAVLAQADAQQAAAFAGFTVTAETLAETLARWNTDGLYPPEKLALFRYVHTLAPQERRAVLKHDFNYGEYLLMARDGLLDENTPILPDPAG